MKVFYSSSFFGGFLFLIRSPTKNPLTFGRKCQMVIFALPYRAMVSTFYKNLPPKKVLHFEKSRLKIPLVMGCPRSEDRSRSLDGSSRYCMFRKDFNTEGFDMSLSRTFKVLIKLGSLTSLNRYVAFITVAFVSCLISSTATVGQIVLSIVV